jgi:tripartite-type tricarboxylate transporter receptor subunit TctC
VVGSSPKDYQSDLVIILAANPNVKAKNLKELVALANATPGGLSYGTSGNASIVHLAD